MSISTFLLVVVLGVSIFTAGRFFPTDSTKKDLIKQGAEQERRKEAQKLCGPCVCVGRIGQSSKAGYRPFPIVTLEHIETGVQFRLEDDWPTTGRGIQERDTVVVHMKDDYDTTRMPFLGYGDLLKVLAH